MSQRFLTIYSGALTAVLAITLLSGASRKIDELTVQRINIQEPNGKLRMVISDHARLPGIIVRGKKRIVMQVSADGAASLSFLDADGKVVSQVLLLKPSVRGFGIYERIRRSSECCKCD